MIIDVYRPIDAPVIAAVENIIEPYRNTLGIEEFTIAPQEDHDGDPVIYIKFKHRLVKPQLPWTVMHTMEREIRDAAWDRGERRFIHTRHNFADQQQLDTSR